MVGALTVETWARSGRAIPAYPRAAAVVRMVPLRPRRPETPA
jgi:hypothetical protein